MQNTGGTEKTIHRNSYRLYSLPLKASKANANEYETEAKEDLLDIKEEVVRRLRECKSSSLTDAEKWFLAQAKSRIQDIGNQVGQTQKVKNALGALDPVLRSSAQYLFIRNKIGSKDGFSEKEISTIANCLVGLRAQVSHEYTLSSFDDLQAEFVRFLEILVHTQMLKRAGVDNYGIELIIGIVFHCNNRMMENILEMNKMNEKT